MATLTGLKIKDTYKSLLKLINNNEITGEAEISDGFGNGTGVKINNNGSFTAASFTATGTITSQGAGDSSFAGNVGIGTTSPSYKLDVSGTGRFTDQVDLVKSIASATNLATSRTNAAFRIKPSNSFDTYLNVSHLGTSVIGIQGTNGGGTGGKNISINPFGNSVGIGTTEPTSKLQVVGLPNYADNATALAGGLTVGAFYHTSGVLKVVI
jgi:hypothetical protein